MCENTADSMFVRTDNGCLGALGGRRHTLGLGYDLRGVFGCEGSLHVHRAESQTVFPGGGFSVGESLCRTARQEWCASSTEAFGETRAFQKAHSFPATLQPMRFA